MANVRGRRQEGASCSDIACSATLLRSCPFKKSVVRGFCPSHSRSSSNDRRALSIWLNSSCANAPRLSAPLWRKRRKSVLNGRDNNTARPGVGVAAPPSARQSPYADASRASRLATRTYQAFFAASSCGRQVVSSTKIPHCARRACSSQSGSQTSGSRPPCGADWPESMRRDCASKASSSAN